MDGFTPSAGQSFDLFEGAMTGNFSQVNLPALPNGLSWDAENLYTAGVVRVVPEPSTLALLAVGAVALLAHRCRRRRPAATARFQTREVTASVTKMLQVCLAVALVASAASGQAATVLFHDTFQGTMSNLWTIVRPNASYYTLQPNDLDLRANSGDLWLGENDALNVFLIPTPTTGNFVVTLGLSSFVPTSQSNAPRLRCWRTTATMATSGPIMVTIRSKRRPSMGSSSRTRYPAPTRLRGPAPRRTSDRIRSTCGWRRSGTYTPSTTARTA